MGNRFLKIFHLAVMALALIALVVFLVLHVLAGLDTQMSKIYLALYVLLIIWAGKRVYTLTKDLIQK